MADALRLMGTGLPAAAANEIAAQVEGGPLGPVVSVNGATGAVVLDAEDVGALAEPTPASPIADITVTGTYGDDDDAIEGAINGILAILRGNGFLGT